METFFNLIQEVQKPGLCHRCGGCVTFCTAVNFGALEIDADGKPRYGEIEKCIECGLCYCICPEVDELEDETRRKVSWSAPNGRIIETSVARAKDPQIHSRGTDGGVVTALLLHLFDAGRIDGAIVTKPEGSFRRRPCLATTREEIIDAAGFYFDTSHGMTHMSEKYVTYSSIEEFAPMVKEGLRRVALVGTPCQIKAFRRMEVLGIVPADSIACCLGLFCAGNFTFEEQQREKLALDHDFHWEDVERINIKDGLMIHIKDDGIRNIPLDDLDFMKRYACKYCGDYTAEFSDISFGGIGAEQGWTTLITRTPLGRAIYADARGAAVEEFLPDVNPNFASDAFSMVRSAAAKKKKTARQNRRELGTKPVNIKD
ncbi:MAG: Coenzyme F420 hydrogenase/dehydrogenase, beta subunit C-terminal domain [Desulfobacteraceae bacterium]